MITTKLINLYQRFFWQPEKYARHIGVSIGKRCWIATRYFGSEPYLITIGDHVQITSDVRFFTHGGGWILRGKFPHFDCFGKIVIGNNVYIGNGAMIMPGVIVGNDVIIAAGSIVTKSIPSGVIVAGNPAKIIGDINQYEAKILQFNMKSKGLNASQKRALLLSADDAMFISKKFLG